MKFFRCATLNLAIVFSLPAADLLPVSVYSRTARGYERDLDRNGNPTEQFYAIGFGGMVAGTTWDQTQDKEDFPEIAGIIATHLAAEKFYFADGENTPEIMVVIHWGRTIPFNDVNHGLQVGQVGDAINRASAIPPVGPGASSAAVQANQQLTSDANAQLDSALMAMNTEEKYRDHLNEKNAELLGYKQTMVNKREIPGTIGTELFDELRLEIEDPRYYVVVSAYDFKELVENEKQELLWVTRISIRTRGNDFMDKVDTMITRAAPYFGRDSGRLIRDYQGDVEFGELETISYESVSAPKED